jgi:long-chain acyl-CoA synthetase
VLYEHPDVVEAAVIGVPHAHYGEEVAAAPGRVPGRGGAARLGKERLSAYKVPHLLAFVDTLSTGVTGKILKRAVDRSLFDSSTTSDSATADTRGGAEG